MIRLSLAVVVLALAACSMTPLNRAAREADPTKLKAMLDKGADPNQRGVVGETPLMSAAFTGNLQAVEALVAAGADVNAKWRYGTPLSYAAHRGHEKVIQLLIDRGAQVDDRAIETAEENGFTALANSLSKSRDKQVGKKEPSVDQPKYVAASSRPVDAALLVSVDQDNDAESVARHLKLLGFQDDRVAVLMSRKASRSQLTAYLEEWLPAHVTPDSTAIFYFSGKGGVDPKTGQALLMPFDVDAAFLQSTAFPLSRLYDSLLKAKAKHVLVVLDASFPGVKFDELKPPAGLTALLAAAEGQAAGDFKQQRHGLLTYYLLKGLTEGKQSMSALYEYAKTHVEEQARLQGRQQTPLLLGDAPAN